MVKSRLLELKKVLQERGEPTKEQLYYARREEQCISQMYLSLKPSDEIRRQYRRTLDKYIGHSSIESLLQKNGISLS